MPLRELGEGPVVESIEGAEVAQHGRIMASERLTVRLRISACIARNLLGQWLGGAHLQGYALRRIFPTVERAFSF